MFLIFWFCLSLFASEAPTTPKKIDVIQAALEILGSQSNPALEEVKQKVSPFMLLLICQKQQDSQI